MPPLFDIDLGLPQWVGWFTQTWDLIMGETHGIIGILAISAIAMFALTWIMSAVRPRD